MAQQDRDILERAVRTLSEQAAKADALVDDALAAGLDGSHQLTVHAKMADSNASSLRDGHWASIP